MNNGIKLTAMHNTLLTALSQISSGKLNKLMLCIVTYLKIYFVYMQDIFFNFNIVVVFIILFKKYYPDASSLFNSLHLKVTVTMHNLSIFILLYPQTKVGDILDSGPSRRRRRRNFLVDAITQKQINIFFSNLVHMLRVPKGRSLF